MTAMLVPYDRQWPRLFEAIAEELRALGDAEWTIEHIGSTSVPGMRAKPIIDVAESRTSSPPISGMKSISASFVTG